MELSREVLCPLSPFLPLSLSHRIPLSHASFLSHTLSLHFTPSSWRSKAHPKNAHSSTSQPRKGQRYTPFYFNFTHFISRLRLTFSLLLSLLLSLLSFFVSKKLTIFSFQFFKIALSELERTSRLDLLMRKGVSPENEWGCWLTFASLRRRL